MGGAGPLGGADAGDRGRPPTTLPEADQKLARQAEALAIGAALIDTPAREIAETLTVNHRWRWMTVGFLLVMVALVALYARGRQGVTREQAQEWQQQQIDQNREGIQRLVRQNLRAEHRAREERKSLVRLIRSNTALLVRIIPTPQPTRTQ